MIPKRIHYCWLGGKPLPPLARACVESWSLHNPDFEIVEWNEKNFSSDNEFYKKALADRQWAFASDFMRLHILHEQGGIYLDVDMEVLKPLSALLHHPLFLGLESETMINGSIIGAVARHELLQKALQCYRKPREAGTYQPIPLILSEQAKTVDPASIAVYAPSYFYPYNPYSQDPLRGFPLQKFITAETYTVHHWQGSWLGIDAEIRQLYAKRQIPALTRLTLKLARIAAKLGI